MSIIVHQRKGFGERGLNLSVSGAVAQDVPEMAKQLVKMVGIVINMIVVVMIMSSFKTMMSREIKSLQIGRCLCSFSSADVNLGDKKFGLHLLF